MQQNGMQQAVCSAAGSTAGVQVSRTNEGQAYLRMTSVKPRPWRILDARASAELAPISCRTRDSVLPEAIDAHLLVAIQHGPVHAAWGADVTCSATKA